MTSLRRTLTLLAVIGGALLSTSATVLAAAPEQPVTEGVTAITGTTATFNGELNPGVSSEGLGYYFLYKTSEPCDGEGRSVAINQSEPQAEGNHKKVSVAVTGLEGSSDYVVCLVAYSLHGEGITPGTSVNFTTMAERPVVIGENPTSITPFAATLQAELNPENQSTSECVFEYGETSAYGQFGKCLPNSISGPQVQTVSLPITGLEPGKTYHYRVTARNATGAVEGEDKTFETEVAKPPSVGSEGAVHITSDGAELEAKVNPNFQTTEYHFEYATKATEQILEGVVATMSGSPPAPPLTGGEEQLAGPVDLTGQLTPGTTYFYRVVATNGTGRTEGPVESFETLAALPTISTGQAEAVTGTTALLSGSIDPRGGPTSYHIVYLTQAAYEAAVATNPGNPFVLGKATAGATVPASNAPSAVTLVAEELAPATAYEFAFVATNSAGTTVGPPAVFTTAVASPSAPESPATSGGPESAEQPYAPIASPFPTVTLPTVIPYQSVAQLLTKEPKSKAALPKLAKCAKGRKRSRGECIRDGSRKVRKSKMKK
jgi:hypothetical protein